MEIAKITGKAIQDDLTDDKAEFIAERDQIYFVLQKKR